MKRSGFTLIEVITAMSANAVLVGLAIVTLVALGRADRTVRDRIEQRRMISQLAEQLREDIHAVEAIAWNANQQELRLIFPNESSMVYQGDKRQWARRLTPAAAESEGELAGAFAVPSRFKINIEPENAVTGKTVHVTLSFRDRARPDAVTVTSELTAVVGRDLQLLH